MSYNMLCCVISLRAMSYHVACHAMLSGKRALDAMASHVRPSAVSMNHRIRKHRVTVEWVFADIKHVWSRLSIAFRDDIASLPRVFRCAALVANVSTIVRNRRHASKSYQAMQAQALAQPWNVDVDGVERL